MVRRSAGSAAARPARPTPAAARSGPRTARIRTRWPGAAPAPSPARPARAVPASADFPLYERLGNRPYLSPEAGPRLTSADVVLAKQVPGNLQPPALVPDKTTEV